MSLRRKESIALDRRKAICLRAGGQRGRLDQFDGFPVAAHGLTGRKQSFFI
jgi:hypothetical protein